jgi:TonB family protein
VTKPISKVLVAALIIFVFSSRMFAQTADLPLIPPEQAELSIVKRVQPEYSPLAKKMGLRGLVRLAITIDDSGKVRDLSLISGHPILAPSAITAVKMWQYKPFQISGKAAVVRTNVEISIPEGVTADDIASEQEFQRDYWENERAATADFKNGELADAAVKVALARAAAEKRGDSKWLELANVITLQGHIEMQQDHLEKAGELYRQSLALHQRHQRPDESEVAGAQQDLALFYMRARETEKAEALFASSVAAYQARIEDTPMAEAKASYGQHLALGYFALAQIARANGQTPQMRERCQKALTYANAWSKGQEKKAIIGTCSSLLK